MVVKIKFNTNNFDLDLNRCGVYEILCLVNNKKYIGSTYTTFRERWGAHRQELIKNNHSNKCLQHEWNLYGEQNFMFNILEIPSIVDKDYIRSLEQKHIDLYAFDSLYNICPDSKTTIGVTQSEEQILLKSKRYIVIDPYDNIYDVINMRQFCRDFNIPQSHMINIANKGNTRHYKGWLAYKYESFSMSTLFYDRQQLRPKRYKIFNTNTNEQYVVDNVGGFCKQYGLDSPSLFHTMSGRRSQHKGYIMKEHTPNKVISFHYDD